MQRIFRRQTWWSIHVIYKSCLGVFYVLADPKSVYARAELLHRENFIT